MRAVALFQLVRCGEGDIRTVLKNIRILCNAGALKTKNFNKIETIFQKYATIKKA